MIFPSSAGTCRDPDNFDKQWRKVRDGLGVPDVTSHRSASRWPRWSTTPACPPGSAPISWGTPKCRWRRTATCGGAGYTPRLRPCWTAT